MHKILITTLLVIFNTQAKTVIAVLDNIIDRDHPRLSPYIYENPKEKYNNADDDLNGKVDDVSGWNFITQNEQVFNESLRGSFPSEVYDYYHLRAKKTLDTISEEELEIYNALRDDDDFMDKRKKFSKYTHGSHVACIALDKSHYPKTVKKSHIKLLPITYLGDAKEGDFYLKDFEALKRSSTQKKLRHINSYIRHYIYFLKNKLAMAIDYSARHANIIHASWGQSYKSTTRIVDGIFEDQFGKKDMKNFESERKSLTRYFQTTILRNATRIINSHPNVLFVFSAGNTKLNNDENPHYPSSIRAKNVISVGASHENERAYFSNFGSSSVTISAPGIAIRSCTPDNKFIPINGTSQAAPQVTRAASIIRELLLRKNIIPTASDLKEIIKVTAKKSRELRGINEVSGELDLKAAIKEVYRR